MKHHVFNEWLFCTIYLYVTLYLAKALHYHAKFLPRSMVRFLPGFDWLRYLGHFKMIL